MYIKNLLGFFFISRTSKTFAHFSQYMAAGILSRLSFDKCRDVMKDAVPVLLKVLCSDAHQVAILVILTD